MKRVGRYSFSSLIILESQSGSYKKVGRETIYRAEPRPNKVTNKDRQNVHYDPFRGDITLSPYL
jgi:hypothetical protein